MHIRRPTSSASLLLSTRPNFHILPIHRLISISTPEPSTFHSPKDPFGLPRPTPPSPYAAMSNTPSGTTQHILCVREKGAGFRCLKHLDRFFDGVEGQLWNHYKTVLRLRQSSWLPQRLVEPGVRDSPPADRFLLTLKTDTEVKDGVYHAFEEDIHINRSVAEDIIQHPDDIKSWEHHHPFLSSLVDRFNLSNGGLKPIGALTSIRTRLAFDGDFLDLDEIRYPFGTEWAIEIETRDPKRAEEAMKGILESARIPFAKSKRSRFENLREGTVA
ncbi:hypothetical protein BC829DRAFT_407396 [Chytridium lagenaria]|nr:hypothetical protein BC829DRAFT_407396 [Chytridium lagenaria]